MKRPLAAKIVEAIEAGELRPGEWLRQIDLEEKFEVGRSDVRAALDELVVRKTIQHVRNRGYRVAIVDDTTLNEIRTVRAILERGAAPLIIQNATSSDLEELRKLADIFSEAVKLGGYLDRSRTNRDFHRKFFRVSGNAVLEEAIWALRERSRAAPLTLWTSHEALVRSDKEHHAIVAALAAKDEALLAALVENHVIRGRHGDDDR